MRHDGTSDAATADPELSMLPSGGEDISRVGVDSPGPGVLVGAERVIQDPQTRNMIVIGALALVAVLALWSRRR